MGLSEGDGAIIDASQQHDRVRRDDLSNQFWVERFMFARRVDSLFHDPESAFGIDGTMVETAPPRTSDARRRATMKMLRGVADILFDNMR